MNLDLEWVLAHLGLWGHWVDAVYIIDYAKAFDCVDHKKLWKILKEMGKPASWENCMQVRKQQLELDMEQQTGSKYGKEYVKAVYCHPAYLTHMQSTS